MPYCPNCGKEIRHNIKFCPHCGSKLQNISTSKTINYSEKLNKTTFENNPIITNPEIYNKHTAATVIGYICSFIPFLQIFGIIFGIYIITRQNPNIKKHGTAIIIISVIMMIIIFLFIFFSYMNYVNRLRHSYYRYY